MKVYVTKWWMARGIFSANGEPDAGLRYFEFGPHQLNGSPHNESLRAGTEAFDTEIEAVKWVKGAAEKRVKSLKKQIAKIEKEWLGE